MYQEFAGNDHEVKFTRNNLIMYIITTQSR
jgi:hypothetical protein